MYSNVCQIQTWQIGKHCNIEECESHQIFLNLSLYLKNGKFKTENGKLKIISSISKDKC